jgi:hypothetical protein
LENRFDKKTRVLTSLLFLFSRGLSTGISIYAPSIILSSVLNWNIYVTNVLTGGIVDLYLCWRAKAITPRNYSFSLFWEQWLLQDISYSEYAGWNWF